VYQAPVHHKIHSAVSADRLCLFTNKPDQFRRIFLVELFQLLFLHEAMSKSNTLLRIFLGKALCSAEQMDTRIRTGRSYIMLYHHGLALFSFYQSSIHVATIFLTDELLIERIFCGQFPCAVSHHKIVRLHRNQMSHPIPAVDIKTLCYGPYTVRWIEVSIHLDRKSTRLNSSHVKI